MSAMPATSWGIANLCLVCFHEFVCHVKDPCGVHCPIFGEILICFGLCILQPATASLLPTPFSIKMGSRQGGCLARPANQCPPLTPLVTFCPATFAILWSLPSFRTCVSRALTFSTIRPLQHQSSRQSDVHDAALVPVVGFYQIAFKQHLPGDHSAQQPLCVAISNLMAG